MWTKEYFYNGKQYEITIDDTVYCDENCADCPYIQTIGEDDFLEICGRTGEVL